MLHCEQDLTAATGAPWLDESCGCSSTAPWNVPQCIVSSASGLHHGWRHLWYETKNYGRIFSQIARKWNCLFKFFILAAWFWWMHYVIQMVWEEAAEFFFLIKGKLNFDYFELGCSWVCSFEMECLESTQLGACKWIVCLLALAEWQDVWEGAAVDIGRFHRSVSPGRLSVQGAVTLLLFFSYGWLW